MGIMDRLRGKREDQPAAGDAATANASSSISPSLDLGEASSRQQHAAEALHEPSSLNFASDSTRLYNPYEGEQLQNEAPLPAEGSRWAGPANVGRRTPATHTRRPPAGLGMAVERTPSKKPSFRLPKEPEFLFSEEASVKTRSWSENLTYYTGSGYLAGEGGRRAPMRADCAAPGRGSPGPRPARACACACACACWRRLRRSAAAAPAAAAAFAAFAAAFAAAAAAAEQAFAAAPRSSSKQAAAALTCPSFSPRRNAKVMLKKGLWEALILSFEKKKKLISIVRREC